MLIESPALPYDFSELEPAMSRDSVVFHFLRHQRVCFDRMRALARDTGLGELSLEELIRVTEKSAAHRALYCCAAEAWNHNLFWRSMRRRCRARTHRHGDRRALRLLRALHAHAQGGGQRPLRQRLAVAGMAQRRGRDPRDAERRDAADARRSRAARPRSVGARLLPRSPEPARRLRDDLPRGAGQLGLCQRRAGGAQTLPATRTRCG
jgi:hypothetical protein